MLYLLPGMGTSKKMYTRDYVHEQITTVDWPEFKNQMSLRELAFQVIEEYSITNSDFAGGTSMGGMVALEIADILKIKHVLLISSCTSACFLNRFLVKTSFFIDFVPLQTVISLIAYINRSINVSSLEIITDTDSRFIKRMIKVVVEWKGCNNLQAKIWRIHGENDCIIPPLKDKCDLLVKNAGHIAAFSHAPQISEFIINQMLPFLA